MIFPCPSVRPSHHLFFPGTTQACGFRDGHDTLTSTGLAIYGLSSDSPKSNTTFKTKQSLPYTLLCNPSYSLIGAIGMQQGSAHKTKRGVFAVDKKGKVLLAMTGGPTPTVDAVKTLVDGMGK
jgi:thioredoxin-dependent peroxiredoxin